MANQPPRPAPEGFVWVYTPKGKVAHLHAWRNIPTVDYLGPMRPWSLCGHKRTEDPVWGISLSKGARACLNCINIEFLRNHPAQEETEGKQP